MPRGVYSRSKKGAAEEVSDAEVTEAVEQESAPDVSPVQEPEPQKHGGAFVYRDNSGTALGQPGSEGRSNFGAITQAALETVEKARAAEEAGGDASHGIPKRKV